MNFHETICGRRFFDAQLPHLTKALERIADGLTQPKMSLPHGMTIEPNFLHDLYYGEYEPSVFKEQNKKQQVLKPNCKSLPKNRLMEQLTTFTIRVRVVQNYESL